jgi:hypothetical protein
LTIDIHSAANAIKAGLDDNGSFLTAATTHTFPIPSLLRLRVRKDIRSGISRQ